MIRLFATTDRPRGHRGLVPSDWSSRASSSSVHRWRPRTTGRHSRDGRGGRGRRDADGRRRHHRHRAQARGERPGSAGGGHRGHRRGARGPGRRRHLRDPGAGAQPVDLRGPQPVVDPDRLHARRRPGRSAVGRRSRRRALPGRRLHRPPAGRAAGRLRPRADRGPARSPGHPLRQEHHRRRHQVRQPRADRHAAGQHLLHRRRLQQPGRQVLDQRTDRRGQGARQAGGRLAAARRLRHQPVHRARQLGQGHDRLPRRPRLAALRGRDRQAAPTTGPRTTPSPRATPGWRPIRSAPSSASPVSRFPDSSTPRAASIRPTAPTPRATRRWSMGHQRRLAVQVDHRPPRVGHQEQHRLRHHAGGDRRHQDGLLRRSGLAGVPVHLHRW